MTSPVANPLRPSGHLTLDLTYYSGVLLKDPCVPLIPACTFGTSNRNLCTGKQGTGKQVQRMRYGYDLGRT